jgi:tRNA (guanosine-2'-O-)-methyltransferase
VQYVDVITDKESYHNKQRRKSMFEALGAQKWMSLKQHKTTTECLSDLKEQGYRIAVTDIHGPSKAIGDISWKAAKTAIVLGNEKNGISDEAREMADIHFHLPMRGFAESLNVSAFCAVAMAYLEAQGCLSPSLDETQKQRIMLTWLARTAPGSTALMRRAGVEVRTDRLYENIAGFTTKPT